jgi:hypothetical protein
LEIASRKENAMELLERYLQAVKRHLPLKRQDDIIAELRANMESQLEDKESELGRPLTQDEAEEWLRKMGAPIVVAGRYQPQQYLIGPGIFPIYWYVLRMALLFAFIAYSVLIAVVIPVVSPQSSGIVESLFRIPAILITVATWVTAAFAAVEFIATHYPGRLPAIDGLQCGWNPSKLPPLEKTTADGRKPRTFAQAVAEIVFGFLVLGWLLLIPKNPFLILGPGVFVLRGLPFQLADVWMAVYWWCVWLNVFQLGWNCVDFWRGTWQHPGRVQHALYKVFGLVPLVYLLAVRDQIYITLKNPAVQSGQYGHVIMTINQSVHFGLLVLTAVVGLQLAWDVLQLAMGVYRKRAAV